MKRAEVEALLDELAAHETAVSAKQFAADQRAHTQLVIATVLIQAHLSAFERVLAILYAQHDETLGPWFDEIEMEAIQVTREAIASDLSDSDAALVARGVDAVEKMFAEFRRGGPADSD